MENLMIKLLVIATLALSAANILLYGVRRPWACYFKGALFAIMIAALMGVAISKESDELVELKVGCALLSMMFVYPTLLLIKRGIYLKNHPEKQGYTNPLA